MRVHHLWKRYYQSLKDVNYAVLSAVASVVYSSIYIALVPFIAFIAPKKKKLSHSAWIKWQYKSETLDDVRKQY